jgi:prophage regulatory protein
MRRSTSTSPTASRGATARAGGDQLDLPMTSGVVQQRSRELKDLTSLPRPPTPLRMLRIRPVCQMTGLGRTTIYQLESDGLFPRRVTMSARAVAWVESEVQAWIASRLASRPCSVRAASDCAQRAAADKHD